MLPFNISVAAGPTFDAPLTARERISLGAVEQGRLREFAAGRAYAKQALAHFGIHECDLTVGADRAPVWPKGVVGSITHVQTERDLTFIGAAVARSHEIQAMGIDFELDHDLHPRLWSDFLTERELERVLGSPIEARRAEATVLWCAKEATAKALGGPFKPREIEIDHDCVRGQFAARFVDQAREGRRPLLGRTGRWGAIYMAAAVLIGTRPSASDKARFFPAAPAFAQFTTS